MLKRLTNNTRQGNLRTLEKELYDSPGNRRYARGAAFLGIALNDCVDGGTCYVCTQGITTIKMRECIKFNKLWFSGLLILSDEKGYIMSYGF